MTPVFPSSDVASTKSLQGGGLFAKSFSSLLRESKDGLGRIEGVQPYGGRGFLRPSPSSWMRSSGHLSGCPTVRGWFNHSERGAAPEVSRSLTYSTRRPSSLADFG